MRERFAEALHLIRRAWTETRPFGWLGRYYQYRTISIWPRPVQQPHPPLYMSGSSPEAGEFAARNHIGIGFAFTTVPLAMARRERSSGARDLADQLSCDCQHNVASGWYRQLFPARLSPQRAAMPEFDTTA